MSSPLLCSGSSKLRSGAFGTPPVSPLPTWSRGAGTSPTTSATSTMSNGCTAPSDRQAPAMSTTPVFNRKITQRRRNNMEFTTPATIREIVRSDHRAAAVFEKFSIDFCCGGNKTLEEACAQKGIDPALISRELQQPDETGSPDNIRPGEWDLDTLSDFIVNNHHRYVRRMLPTLQAHLD